MAQVLTTDQYVESPERLTVFRKISWGAIIAGVLVAIVVQLLLTLLGLGIGMSTVDPMREANPMQGLGTPALIWWAVSMIISLFIGGWVTGRESNLPERTDRFLNGLIMWAVFTLLSFYFVQRFTGTVIGGATNVIGSALSSVVEAGSNNADITQRAEAAIRGTSRTEVQQQTARTEQQARQTGEKVASAVSKAAIYGFIGLLIGALVAGFASSVAKPVYDILNLPGKVVK